MKNKIIAFMLSLVLCLSLCSCGNSGTNTGDSSEQESESPVLIADVLDPATCKPEKNIKTFQDIASFLGRRIDEWDEDYRRVELVEEDRTAVLEYINLLINEFDYEITETYKFEPNADNPFGKEFLDGYWEVYLSLSTVDTGRDETGYLTDQPCDIVLCGKKDKLHVRFSDLFHTEDFGYRWSGSKGDRFKELYGQRVLDSYWLENGRYHNGSDGVLSVEAGTDGEAMILINGKEVRYSTEAFIGHEVYVDYTNDDYRIFVKDFLDGVEAEEIEITVPKTLLGGEVYTLSDGLAPRGDSPIWAIYDPGEGKWSQSDKEPVPRSAINAFTIRVLKWDKVECVVYISMDIVTELEPMTIEILAAMPAYGSLHGDTFKEESAITLKVGETLELEYDAPYVFMPNYETYDWKVTSGQGAAISGYNDTCTVTAVSAGKVIIRCVYSYGEDEPDVLTGILRNENHTKTKLYYINIIP